MPDVLDLTVHHYTRIPGTMDVRLVKTTPYVRLSAGNEPPLFVQGGLVFSAGGPLVEELPPWFWEEARRLSAETRQACGLTLPEEAPTPAPPNVWTCPECNDTIPAKKRGVHATNHRRRRRVEAAGEV